MTARRRARRSQTALTGALLAVLLCLVPVGAAHGASPADPKDGNLSVVVTDPPGATPSPSSSAPAGGANGGSGGSDGSSGGSGGSTGGAGGGASGNGGGNSGGGSAGSGSTGGAGQTPTTPVDEVSMGGMLYVGGLTSSAAISPNPGEGDVTLWFTVRNASQSTIDATAEFWTNSLIFGNEIDAADDVRVAGLQPGESRVVSARLHRGGQWTLLSAHVTLAPPDSVDGVALTPVTRDATVFLFPWLLALVLVVAAMAVVLAPRIVRGMQRPQAIVTSA